MGAEGKMTREHPAFFNTLVLLRASSFSSLKDKSSGRHGNIVLLSQRWEEEAGGSLQFLDQLSQQNNCQAFQDCIVVS